jgi:SnoaL-like domain
MLSLEQRLHRLEARDDIRRCIYAYAEAGDRHNAPEVMSTLFTQQACYVVEGLSSFTGCAAITQGLADIGRNQVAWSFHLPGRILLALADDGASATADWVVWEPANMVMSGEENAMWLAGAYAATLDQSEGSWKFSNLTLTVKFFTPFEGPWTPVKGDFVFPG